MAPAEKFGASLPTTSAAKFRSASRDAGLEHLQRVAADRVHLRVELDGRARRRPDRRGWRRRSCGRLAPGPSPSAESRGPAHAGGAGAARIAAWRVEHVPEQAAARRRRSARFRQAFTTASVADGVDQSRTARAPSRSPTASRDRRRRSSAQSAAPHARCRSRLARASRAGRLPTLSCAREQRAHALADVLRSACAASSAAVAPAASAR